MQDRALAQGPAVRRSFMDIAAQQSIEKARATREADPIKTMLKAGGIIADAAAVTTGAGIGGVVMKRGLAKVAGKLGEKKIPQTVANISGRVAGAGSTELGIHSVLSDPELSPEEAAIFAGGAEAVMGALTPLGGPLGKFTMKMIGAIPGIRNISLPSIPLITRGLKGQRPGVDEAISILNDLPRTGGRQATMTVGQTLERSVLNNIEGAIEGSLTGSGPLMRTRDTAVKAVGNRLKQFANDLAERSPEDAMTVLESVIRGSSQLHRKFVRGAYREVDRVARRAGVKEATKVDLRPFKAFVDRTRAKGSPSVKSMKEMIEKEYGDFVSYEEADEIRSTLLAIGRTSSELLPDYPPALARKWEDCQARWACGSRVATCSGGGPGAGVEGARDVQQRRDRPLDEEGDLGGVRPDGGS
jgi:hypothetical protein